MAARARTNVSLDAELLEQAREFEINLSAMLEARLREVVAERRRQRWLNENREALADANEFLDHHGLWSDGLRQF